MRKLGIIAALSLLLVALAATAALAGNPHFIRNATNATLSGDDLVVNFKEAGLESGSVETVTVSADALTTYQCVNRGGHNPSASNKTTTASELSESDTFRADRSGNITGTQTLSPPTAAELGFSCPSGQRVEFVSVTYSNVMVVDDTSGASIAIPGEFSFTNPNAAE
jgi:hypothetical protein